MPLFQTKNRLLCRFFNAKIGISAVFSKKKSPKLPFFQNQRNKACYACAHARQIT